MSANHQAVIVTWDLQKTIALCFWLILSFKFKCQQEKLHHPRFRKIYKKEGMKKTLFKMIYWWYLWCP